MDSLTELVPVVRYVGAVESGNASSSHLGEPKESRIPYSPLPPAPRMAKGYAVIDMLG